MARFSVDDEENDEEPTSKKRKRNPKGSEDTPDNSNSNSNKTTTLDKGYHSQNMKIKEELKEGELEEEEEEEEERREQEQNPVADEEVGDGRVCYEGCQNNNSGIAVRIDPDVLDCSICFEAFQPPLFQCQNGHVACSSCCTNLRNKCHICSRSIGLIRCLALEKVIESIRVPCLNARYGCKEILSYTQRDAHKEACGHVPCSCPDSYCTFKGSPRDLSFHFLRHHKDSGKKFWYERPFKVSLEYAKPFLVLHGADNHLFLLLNNSAATEGNALSVTCMRSNTEHWDFIYELTADGKGSNLHLKSSAASMRQWMGIYPNEVFLFVPRDFFAPYRKIILDVCVRKIKSPANSASGMHV